MKEIGGFFELELNNLGEYHKDAIRLNTGRNCLEYILQANNYTKIFIPYFICEVILEPLKKCNIEYEFYQINKDFNPIFDYSCLTSQDSFLYVNYFGLKQNTIIDLSDKIENLIVDNTQAFFAKPINNVHTFYSPRKFFGVADGAYLYTDNTLDETFQKDKSYERMSHLLKRIDQNSNLAYTDFRDNSAELVNSEIKVMSNITKSILCSIDYKIIKKIREQNFIYIHESLGNINLLDISLKNLNAPMVYPLMVKDNTLRHKLIKNKIYIAQYWPNVLKWCNEEQLEYDLSNLVIPIPIDQRYGKYEMNSIIKILK